MKYSKSIKYALVGLLGMVLSGSAFTSVYGAETIAVDKPVAGEKLKAGNDCLITWSSDGVQAPYLKISLLDNSGKTVDKISGGAPNRGSFSWKIPPGTETGEYQVKIFTNDLKAEGVSGVFTIEAGINPKSRRTENKESDMTGLKSKTNPVQLPEADSKPDPRTIPKSPKSVHQGTLVTPVVSFDDSLMEAAVRKVINKPAPVTVFSSFLKKLTVLDLSNLGIEKLTGLEYCHALNELNLAGNKIVDISRLALLDSLKIIRLDNNGIKDLKPLVENEHLAGGVEIDLRDNPVDCKEQREAIEELRRRGVTLKLDCD